MSKANSAVSVTIETPLDYQEHKELTKEQQQNRTTWTTMTPQQIAMWIDK